METEDSSETLVTMYKFTQRRTPENINLLKFTSCFTLLRNLVSWCKNRWMIVGHLATLYQLTLLFSVEYYDRIKTISEIKKSGSGCGPLQDTITEFV
jgi:hypothetical protein